MITFDFSKFSPSQLKKTWRTSTLFSKILVIVLVLLFFGCVGILCASFPKSPAQSLRNDNYTSKLVSATVNSSVDKQKKTINATLSDNTKVSVNLKVSVLDIIQSGDKILVYKISEGSSNNIYSFYDFDRSSQVIVIVFIFLLLLIIVARLRGIGTILTICVSSLIIYFVTIPMLYSAQNIFLVSIITSALILYFVVFLSHGFSIKSSVAMFSVIIGVLVGTGLIYYALTSMKIVGHDGEEAINIINAAPNVSIQEITVFGMVLSLLGILVQTALFQVSIVYETIKADHNIISRRRELVAQSLKIGINQVDRTIFSIFYILLGLTFVTFLWHVTNGESFYQKIGNWAIADEIIFVSVGGISLIITYVLTTLIASAAIPKLVPKDDVPLPPPPTEDDVYILATKNDEKSQS